MRARLTLLSCSARFRHTYPERVRLCTGVILRAGVSRQKASREDDAMAKPRSYVYLDTETTGLFGDVRIVDVAIVDDAGEVLVDTLVDPGIPIPVETSRIHGIFD